MLVYRICLVRFASGLVASGRAARWNPQGCEVLYTAGSRALACLENLVHRRYIGSDTQFRVLTIEIPAAIKIEEVTVQHLSEDWTDFANISQTQIIGAQWIDYSKTAVLKIPSAIIPSEFNYLINPAHPDFKKVKIKSREAFVFDSRLFG